MKKTIKIILMVILISFIATSSTFAGDFLQLDAGWEKASAYAETAVVGVKFLNTFGVDLNIGYMDFIAFDNPKITELSEGYINDVLTYEYSGEYELDNNLTIRGVIIGAGPYLNLYEKQGIKFQALTQFNLLILNATFSYFDDYYSETIEVDAQAVAIELIPAIGIEVQPFDPPLIFIASVGYSMTWLISLNANIDHTFVDISSNICNDTNSYEITPNSFLGQTIFLFGGKVQF